MSPLRYEVIELEFTIMVRVWNKAHTSHMQKGFTKSRWQWLNHRRIRAKKRSLEELICIDGSYHWTREYLDDESLATETQW